MNNLKLLKVCENAIEANRYKQILLENGIQSYIANELTIQSDWLLSNALGGIRLQVFENDLEAASKILEDFENNEDFKLEVEHTIENPDFNFTCPKCGSNHIYRDEKPGGLFGISLLLIGIPIKASSDKYICYYCGNQFNH